MIYQWKTGFNTKGVKAEDAGALFKELETKQELTAKKVVEVSRPKDALLHNCFEWDDKVAGELYREQQASFIIRNLAVTVDNSEPVRAFVNLMQEATSYESIEEVMKSDVKIVTLLDQAKQELIAFKMKYKGLNELVGVFAEIDKLNEKEGA